MSLSRSQRGGIHQSASMQAATEASLHSRFNTFTPRFRNFTKLYKLAASQYLGRTFTASTLSYHVPPCMPRHIHLIYSESIPEVR